MRRRTLAALVASTIWLIGASPSPLPSPQPPGENHLTAAQMKAMLPKTPLHTEYVVAVNKLGQVTGAKAKTLSKDKTFNAETYGNALQAFIRTEDGKAISGVYSLSYDYNPQTQRISRDVALVHAGGVNPDAEGAALVMMDAARKEAAEAAAKGKHPSPAPHVAPTASSKP
jgi:hypothetical protein